MMEMYLDGVSVRRIEDITEAIWGARVSAGTISNLNKKIYGSIEEWRNRPLEAEYPYIYMDGIWLKRSWGGTVENVSVLVAVGVNKEGYREMPGAAEGSREDAENWKHFCRYLKERGLRSAKLIISDKSLGILEALGDFFPESHWQRCAVHFYRNVLSAVPVSRFRKVSAMLKAIHAQEDREAARVKVKMVIEKLKQLKLEKAAARWLEEPKKPSHTTTFPRLTGAVSAQITRWSGSTVKSEDGRELSEISLTASPRLCWYARG